MTDQTTIPVRAEPRRLRPFEMFEEFEELMDRFWSEVMGAWPGRWLLREFANLPAGWTPRVDMFEQDGYLVVRAALPGVRPQDIDVELEDGDLVIRGERKSEQAIRAEDYYRREWQYGRFYRRIELPFAVKPEQIQATFRDGVLEVRIPKPAELKPPVQKIPVTTA